MKTIALAAVLLSIGLSGTAIAAPSTGAPTTPVAAEEGIVLAQAIRPICKTYFYKGYYYYSCY